MTIYEIDSEILNLIDPETGEITDLDALEALSIQREEKIENLACWIKNLISESNAIEEEEKVLKKRREITNKNAERLKNYLSSVLGGNKFSSAKCSISFRKSEETSIIDESLIPEEFIMTKVETKPNKMAIKESIKKGIPVAGAELIEHFTIQIK